ncbi:MAG: DUF6259 domain-containing protein [Firmicutes bacterium]|nr:DUF6259 domain-containing protein [Bacillota bacterium]
MIRRTTQISPAAPVWRQEKDRYIVTTGTYALALSVADGSILSLIARGSQKPILRSGEYGLWHLRFRNGDKLSATSLSPQTEIRGNTLYLRYSHPQALVTVQVIAQAEYIDWMGEVSPHTETVLDFALPARCRFDHTQLVRLVCPMDGNQSVGAAFTASFFGQQPEDRPSAWRPAPAGPDGYIRLFGGALVQRADDDPPVEIEPAAQASRWLPERVLAGISGARAIVNRPSRREHLDVVLVDSPNGVYFGARQMGAGYLWRVGGRVESAQKGIVRSLVTGVLEKLGVQGRIGLIVLTNAPRSGGWAAVTISEWQESLQELEASSGGRLRLQQFHSVPELLRALREGSYLAVINPYGEWLPAPPRGGIEATLESIRYFVQNGGHWFEVGGYPFFYALQPVQYFSIRVIYPPAFADFLHWETQAGNVSLYRVQPRNWQPWDREHLFIPGWLAWGGDENGGYAERAFGTYVPAGSSWRAPVVRVHVGKTAQQALQMYAKANGIHRRLSQKMRRPLLERFKRAVLVYYAGNASEKLQALPHLPVPSLIHFADYLKGGFDKEYPDHLPPHPGFGTTQELAAFLREARRRGHLVMPYTNPTWWCDDPKGPTFQREGDAPLLRTLDGQLSRERYGQNEGYTICFWHPAVQRANRRTRQQFTEQFPVDILFQDQCGARGWLYDTNPVSPSPYAYTEGLLSMVAEDSAVVPLSTESGWDQVAEYESQLCGMAWSLIPTEYAPDWRTLLREQFPPHAWEVFPLAQFLAHDKAAMVMHDLGQFVTNREVLAWVLGLGFGISARVSATALSCDSSREWLRWLSRLQQSVCARYIGEPLRAFRHERIGKGEGILRADFGRVRVVANLNPHPQQVTVGRQGVFLASFGYYAVGEGMLAANLQAAGKRVFDAEGVSFVIENRSSHADLWVYARAGESLAVPWQGRQRSTLRLHWDSGVTFQTAARDGTLSLTTPTAPARQQVAPPATLAKRAPRDWMPKPAIGVLDMPGLSPVWSTITPEKWLRALQASRLTKEWKVPVRAISSAAELNRALDAGVTRWFAIVNPYGEVFPAEGGWASMLERIKRYVQNGGIWWETAGYSFFIASYPQRDGWRQEVVSTRGMETLGLPVGGGSVEQPPEPLLVPEEGRRWLGERLSEQVSARRSVVNRGLPRSPDAPPHVALVSGQRDDFIGGYRLGGWGWLWRIGGFYPNPDVAIPVVVAVLERLYSQPPPPPQRDTVRRVWHATIT